MRKLTPMQQEYLRKLDIEKKQVLEDNRELIEAFKAKLGKLGCTLEDSNFQYIQTTGIIAEHENIVGILNPELRRDKEGLIRMSKLDNYYSRKPFIDGVFFSQDYIILAHRYFRRGFHPLNNYAPKFIHNYWRLDHSCIESYISIDYDRVRIDINDCAYLEEDTWFGANFTENLKDIKPGIVKLRPPSDLDDFHIQFFFNNAYALDIKWEVKDSVKSFQAKEFKTIDVTCEYQGEQLHPVRYIHAEYDMEENHFRHFDGAIHFYTTDEYVDRIDSDFNHNVKINNHIKSKSFKLFKINGRTDINLWVHYCSHFFSKNPLILEYFQGEYPEYLRNTISKIRNRN